MITTERLVLRPWTGEDADGFARLMADPAFMSFSLTGPMDRETALRRLDEIRAAQERDGFSPWAAQLRDGGELAGMIGVGHPWFLPGYDTEVEAGWRLLPAFRGRGLATEGARAAIAWAFERLPVARVLGIVQPDNVGSLRVAERLGMTQVAEETLAAPIGSIRILAVARPPG